MSGGSGDAGGDAVVGGDAAGGDVGTGADARDPADDPLNAAATCTSGRMWTRGNRGSESMNPGRACIDCHSTDREAPTLTLAGTVYPSGHEPDLCNGSGTASSGDGLVVEVTDATGAVIRIVPNAVGNFESRRAFTPPYRARDRRRPRARDDRRADLGRLQLVPHGDGRRRRPGPHHRSVLSRASAPPPGPLPARREG